MRGLSPEFLQPLSPLSEAVTVDFLIDGNYGSWDADLFKSIFEEEVAT
jgi:hypothetical protein